MRMVPLPTSHRLPILAPITWQRWPKTVRWPITTGCAPVPMTLQFSSTAEWLSIETVASWERTTAPWARTTPAPTQAVPRISAESAILGSRHIRTRMVETHRAPPAPRAASLCERSWSNDPPRMRAAPEGLEPSALRPDHGRVPRLTSAALDRQPSPGAQRRYEPSEAYCPSTGLLSTRPGRPAVIGSSRAQSSTRLSPGCHPRVGARKSVVALSCEFVEKPPGRAMIAA